MKSTSLAFLLGILLLQNFTHLPKFYWIGIIFFITSIFFLIRKKPFIKLIIAFGLGFTWSLWYAHHQLNWLLPAELEGKTIQLTGYIHSLPNYAHHRSSFIFYVKTIDDNEHNYHAKNINHLIKLSWMQSKNELIAGDKWCLNVKLKRIHGGMNPGGFDYEGWAWQEGISAAGYVVSKQKNSQLSSHWYHYPLNRLRQFIQTKINKNLPKSNTSPWIEALILGERHNISSANWEVLRNTGTNHLMAIAGLHIGFMAAFIHQISLFIWSRTSFIFWLPAQQAAAIASLLFALVYSAMAGFSIPTQRACIMLAVFLMTVLLRRKIIAWQAWSIALLLVLLLNPLSVLTESFWLSFGSVALIIYGMSGRLAIKTLWWKWGRVQWVIAVGLIPFGIWLFHQGTLIGFIANSIAIPWVGFVLVPLCLMGGMTLLISEKLGGIILLLADKLLGLLWSVLSFFAHLPWASWYQVMPNYWVLIAACVGIALLLLPAGAPGRYIGIIWLLPLILYHPAKPKVGDVWLTLLDVGQGLSTVVQTQNHLLIFDAGPRLGDSFDMGESVVNPFLDTLQTKKIDMLVVSHGDNDHSGGSFAILNRFPVASVKTSVPSMFANYPASYCLRDESWKWDGVQFDFLYPSLSVTNLGNDSSCVLRISTGNEHILLTGDIEKSAEKYLVNQERDKLFSQILIAPHHGSKTSAQDSFISAVNPSYVLYAVGYRNRYHFPNPSVVKKYDDLNVKQLDTVNSGAIQFAITKSGIISVLSYRKNHGRYWNQL